MKPEILLKADFLDILFENRNKEYGAYELRHHYAMRLKAALLAIVKLSLLFTLAVVFHANVNKGSHFIPPEIKEVTLAGIPEKNKQQPKENQKQQSSKVKRQVANPTYVIVADKFADKVIHTTKDLDSAQIGVADVGGIKDYGPNTIKSGEGIDTGKLTETLAVMDNHTAEPFEKVEVMPEFPGGNGALIQFLLRHLRPAEDLEEGQRIIVNAKFVIDEDGQITAPQIISDRSPYDNEVLRVIAKMPLWKPGIQNGVAVPVYFNLPVTFERID